MQFQKIDQTNIQQITKYLNFTDSFCDFTPATLFMWADYFNFEFCIEEEILFVKNAASDDLSETVFFPPLANFTRGIEILSEYCRNNRLPLVLSPVSFDFLEKNGELKLIELRRLADWSDYVYRVSDFATLSGRKFNGKRNHVNKFTSTYKFEIRPFSDENAEAALEFLSQNEPTESLLHIYEHDASKRLIKFRKYFNLLGAVLYVEDKIAGVTVAEAFGKTLYVHIEKADRQFVGVYETLAHLFAKEFCGGFEFFNREEDMGLEGLRRSKLSWQPLPAEDKLAVSLDISGKEE